MRHMPYPWMSLLLACFLCRTYAVEESITVHVPHYGGPAFEKPAAVNDVKEVNVKPDSEEYQIGAPEITEPNDDRPLTWAVGQDGEETGFRCRTTIRDADCGRAHTVHFEGDYSGEEGSGEGGGTPTYKFDRDIVAPKVEIIDTPHCYYADATANVPLVFRITPVSMKLAVEEIRLEFVEFKVAGRTYTWKGGSGADIVMLCPGNLTTGEDPANVFTAVIPAVLYDAIGEIPGDVAAEPAYRIKVSITKELGEGGESSHASGRSERGTQSEGGVKLDSEPYKIDWYGDSSICVFELGGKEKAIRAGATAQYMDKCMKAATPTYLHYGATKYRENPPQYNPPNQHNQKQLESYGFAEAIAKRAVDGVNPRMFLNQTRLTSRDAWTGSHHNLGRVAMMNEQRGFYCVIYYGYIETREYGNVVDVRKDGTQGGGLSVAAFEGYAFHGVISDCGDQVGLDWPNFTEAAMTATEIFATLASGGFSWPALALSLGVAGIDIVSDVQPGVDRWERAGCATFATLTVSEYATKKAVIENADPSSRKPHSWHSNGSEQWTAGACILRPNLSDVHALDTLEVCVSGSVWCQTVTSTAPFGGTEVSAQLEWKGGDPYLRLAASTR
ncbi:MAG: hypothetical protein JXR37_22810 [Kiritimatiellae bacterium]|nr:hypothetical protein [Kiritimatiellia bacterium]